MGCTFHCSSSGIVAPPVTVQRGAAEWEQGPQSISFPRGGHAGKKSPRKKNKGIVRAKKKERRWGRLCKISRGDAVRIGILLGQVRYRPCRKMLSRARLVSRSARSFSSMFESKNNIKSVRSKYYSNPTVGKSLAQSGGFGGEAGQVKAKQAGCGGRMARGGASCAITPLRASASASALANGD